MNFDSLKENFEYVSKGEYMTTIKFDNLHKVDVYNNSIQIKDGASFFIGKENQEKSLYILSNSNNELLKKFNGTDIIIPDEDNLILKKCSFNHPSSLKLQELFPFTKPIPLGLTNSFGFGDRLGLANAGHIRSLKGYDFKPIFAQQSIRELTRTQRIPEDVLDAAVWAVFQEGFLSGYGADADHLKTKNDIDLLVAAGFPTFTFDPGEYVNNDADILSDSDLKNRASEINWGKLNDSLHALTSRYEGKKFEIGNGFIIHPSLNNILKAAVKYSGAILHIKNLYDHLAAKLPKGKYEVEVSVDETDSVTSPFEHFFIASELIRLNVEFISLAPRFIGDFEKGIDYKGDLNLFKNEYEKHAMIAKYFGNYKISLHSGSDKFSAYKVIGSLNIGFTHVKTAGTSYLEALKVVAIKSPALFREILDFSASIYDIEKKSYHVSADMNKIKKGKEYKDEELEGLFNSTDARQALHVTYGRVLTEKDSSGQYLFREKIYKCLIENEELHYEILIKHFKRHMEPFKLG